MINGKDNISLQVLAAFNEKQKLAVIAKNFNMSLDQVKRLKRYHNYSNKILDLAGEDIANAFMQLGTKGLFLSKYIKEENTDALSEILSVTTEQTTRDELRLLIQQFEAKQQRIQNFEQHYQSHKQQLVALEAQHQKSLEQLQAQKEVLSKKLDFANHYDENVRPLLLHYVGPYHDGYALRRRLDSGFRKALKAKNIIHLNDEYIWEIKSLDDFAQRLAIRLKYGHYIEWNYERELKRNEKNSWASPSVSKEEDYKAIRTFTEEIEQIEFQIKIISEELQNLSNEHQILERDFIKQKSASIQSFEEASLASDLMSERELLRHKEMQSIATKWLYSKGFIAASEITLPNQKRADVIAFNNEKVIIIEVKSSYQDYIQDQKWTEYLPYCDEFYFFLDFHVADIAEKKAGFLALKGRSLTIEIENTLSHHCLNPEEIKWIIGRSLSKKNAFGWS